MGINRGRKAYFGGGPKRRKKNSRNGTQASSALRRERKARRSFKRKRREEDSDYESSNDGHIPPSTRPTRGLVAAPSRYSPQETFRDRSSSSSDSRSTPLPTSEPVETQAPHEPLDFTSLRDFNFDLFSKLKSNGTWKSATDRLKRALTLPLNKAMKLLVDAFELPISAKVAENISVYARCLLTVMERVEKMYENPSNRGVKCLTKLCDEASIYQISAAKMRKYLLQLLTVGYFQGVYHYKSSHPHSPIASDQEDS